MIFKTNLSATAAIILDFTNLQRIHNCARADGIYKTNVCYSSNYRRLHKAPTSSQLPVTAATTFDFTILQRLHTCPRADGIEKNWSASTAIILYFTMPQGVHNCPRADGIKNKLVSYSSNCPRLHKAPTSSQLSKSGWYLKKPCLLQQQLS